MVVVVVSAACGQTVLVILCVFLTIWLLLLLVLFSQGLRMRAGLLRSVVCFFVFLLFAFFCFPLFLFLLFFFVFTLFLLERHAVLVTLASRGR